MVKVKKENIVMIVLIAVMLLAIIGVSYAAFNYSKTGTKLNSITTGSITMSYTESDSIISIDKALPTRDETGKVRLKEGEYFDFTVSSEIVGDININYEISAKDVTTSNRKIDGSNIKMYLTRLTDNGEEELMSPETYNEKVNANSYTGRPTGEMSLYTSSMSSSESNRYRLRMWVDEKYNPQEDGGNLSFSVKINVYGKDGNSLNIKPNTPELDTNMIAVRYNGSDFLKADSSTNSWYNYDKQEWANAVTVSSNTRDRYLEAEVGTKIDMADIETMWVWIPRYSYSIGSEDGTNYYGKQGDYLDSTPTVALPGEIDVKFVDKTTKDRGTAKYVVSEGLESDSWYTPDAFTFGNEELSGIWVGKFETSSSDPSIENGGGNTTSLDPMIKPNVTSWILINVSNIYQVGLKLSAVGNRYGFSENMNSHAMRNDEWGAVAYLSQSRYGKLGNENFKGANKEVYQNKSNSYITGCSYGAPSNGNTDYGCQYTYDANINGTGASTTGTIYGVYDMSGGAWEYVMGNYNDVSGNSGFSNPLTIDSKYYNKYTNNDVSVACNGSECLSHGLSETSGWYNDFSPFIFPFYSWMIRGIYGDKAVDHKAGVFRFNYTDGLRQPKRTFRLVMSVTSP